MGRRTKERPFAALDVFVISFAIGYAVHRLYVGDNVAVLFVGGLGALSLAVLRAIRWWFSD